MLPVDKEYFVSSIIVPITLHFRIKFEPGNSSKTEFYRNDLEMPVYSRAVSGYPVGDLVKILLSSDVSGRKVCTVQPLGVCENAAFIVDIETVDHQDLKADDLGSWHPTGTKKSYFRFSSDGTLRVSEKRPRNMPSDYYVLTRRYYTHKSYDKYHRLIADIRGKLLSSFCNQRVNWMVVSPPPPPPPLGFTFLYNHKNPLTFQPPSL